MKPYQMSALKCLASYGLIDSELLPKNRVVRTTKEIPQKLLEKLSELSIEKSNVIKLLVGFNELSLYGKMGLKYRTGLIEFRYDQR